LKDKIHNLSKILFQRKKLKMTEMIFKFLTMIKNNWKKVMIHKKKIKQEPNLIIKKIIMLIKITKIRISDSLDIILFKMVLKILK
jgi:prophage antirepressor-like protein